MGRGKTDPFAALGARRGSDIPAFDAKRDTVLIPGTERERLKLAFRALRKTGIAARLLNTRSAWDNYDPGEDCRGWVASGPLQESFYSNSHSLFPRKKIPAGKSKEDLYTKLYFYFQGGEEPCPNPYTATEVAETLIRCLREAGFAPVWKGDTSLAVYIEPKE